jgi:hypothetical protein
MGGADGLATVTCWKPLRQTSEVCAAMGLPILDVFSRVSSRTRENHAVYTEHLITGFWLPKATLQKQLGKSLPCWMTHPAVARWLGAVVARCGCDAVHANRNRTVSAVALTALWAKLGKASP